MSQNKATGSNSKTDDDGGRLNRLEAVAESAQERALNAEERAEAAEKRADEAEERVGELEARVKRLETAVDANPDGKAYDDMDLDERVGAVQHFTVKRAMQNGGKARIDYKDVLALFQDNCSDGYAFKLMRKAAGVYENDSEKEGFGFGNNAEGEYRLSVNVEDVNDEALIHAVKNDLGRCDDK